jgi:hypothetical protein
MPSAEAWLCDKASRKLAKASAAPTKPMTTKATGLREDKRWAGAFLSMLCCRRVLITTPGFEQQIKQRTGTTPVHFNLESIQLKHFEV